MTSVRVPLLFATAWLSACGGGVLQVDDVDEPVEGIEPSTVDEPLVARLTDAQFEYTVLDIFGEQLSEQERGWLPRTETIPGHYSTEVASQNFADEFVVNYARIARSLSERLDAEDLLDEFGGCSDFGTDCLSDFVDGLGLRLWRRPLSVEERDVYIDLAAAIDAGDDTTDDHLVEGIVQALLQAPAFLYRVEQETSGTPGTLRRVKGWELASRLSYFLWLSAPDAELLEFAAGPDGDGVFRSVDLLTQIDRMMRDARFQRAERAFWGDYSLVSTASFATVDARTAEELRASMLASFDHLSGPNGSAKPLSELFDGNEWMMTGAVAELAGVPSQGDGMELYTDVPERGGILTHPAFIAAMGTTSFVGRGEFMTERLLCQSTPPPPSDPETSTRIEETEQATINRTPREASEYRFGLEGSCTSCHTQFEPIAYAFERYDSTGRYTTTDDEGRDLYSDGVLPGYLDRVEIPFTSAPELLNALAVEPAVARCLVENMMEFGFGASPKDAEPFVEDAAEEFAIQGETFEALARSVAFSQRLTLMRSVQE